MILGAVSIIQFHFGVVIGSQLADQQAAAQCRLLAPNGHDDMWLTSALRLDADLDRSGLRRG